MTPPPRDPDTPDDWREAATLAEVLLRIDSHDGPDVRPGIPVR